MSMDMFGIPFGFKGDVQIFDNWNYDGGTISPYTWRRPRGCSMAMLIAISGGAGGGGGHSAASGNARGGGGGGCSSGWAKVIIPLILLPDTLYMLVGRGGSGGTATNDGGGGIDSIIGISPRFIDLPDWLLQSNSTAPQKGIKGTATGGGAGGSSTGTTAVSGNSERAGLGIFLSVNGQVGANGGAHTGAVGGAIAIPTNGTFSQAGAGGAGTQSADFAGGIPTLIAGSYLSEQLSTGAAAGSFDGPGGRTHLRPFFGLGGCGGSSSNTGIGGNGGNGGWPGGGGGGGGGGTTGGTGGDGGNGAVIIVSW